MRNLLDRAVKPVMDAMREAFRRQRLANNQGRLHSLYIENNLFDEARKSRLLMLGHLRLARRHWRTVLGLGAESGSAAETARERDVRSALRTRLQSAAQHPLP